MTSLEMIQQIMFFDAIGIINTAYISEETIDEDLSQVAECFKRFINFDFGDVTSEIEADNNIAMLTGADTFGSYQIRRGKLHILKMDGRYRLVFEGDEEDGDK